MYLVCIMVFSYALYGIGMGMEGDSNPKPSVKRNAFEEVQTLVEKVNIPIPLQVTLIGQAIQDGRIYAYRRELEDALKESAFDFFRTVKSQDESFSIFNKMTKVPKENAIETLQPRNQLYDTAFYEEALNLLIAVTPPLGKQDREGLKASDLAQLKENQALYSVLQKHNRIQSRFELEPGDKTDLWGRHISLIPLEKHPVAQAIVLEDPKALYQALEEAFSKPAKDFLSLLHSRTSDHKTLFHLAAEVKSHQAEIAQAIDSLITFSAPNQINFVKKGYDYHRSPVKDVMAQGAMWLSIAGILASAHFFATGQGGLGTLSFFLAAGGLGVCERAFRSNNKTDPIIKNRRF